MTNDLENKAACGFTAKTEGPDPEKDEALVGLTEAQKLAVRCRKRTVIVTASAGAGKTSTMINRVLDFVVNKGVDLSSVVMLTFTNKSAQEMKSRLSSKLHEEIAKAINPEKRSRLAKAIDVLPLFHCSTIDSFCFKIVKSHFQMLGLSPMLSLLDEEGQERAMERAARELLEEYYRAEPDEFHTLMDCFGGDEEKVTGAIKKIYKFAMTTEAPDAFLTRAEEVALLDPQDTPAMRAFYRRINDDASRLFSRISLMPRFSPTADSINNLRRKIETSLELFAKASTLAEVSEAKAIGKLSNPGQKGATESDMVSYREMKDAFTLFRNNISENSLTTDALAKGDAVTADAKAETLRLIGLTRRFKEIYAEIKQEALALDFFDVEHCALTLFADCGVAKELGCKFLLVDECQDLNPLQDKLMQNIVEDNDLFMVGDVKQSIYRFRLSDPLILQGKIKDGKRDPDAEVIDFSSNFRSCNEIVDFVNTVFSRLMSEEFGGVEYPLADRNGITQGSGYVRCFFYDKTKEESATPNGVYSVRKAARDKAAESARACLEGEWVRNRIRELVGTSYISTDARIKEPQTIHYGDIAILSAKKMRPDNLQEHIVETLRHAGIPVNIGGFVNDRDYSEISAIVDFLRLIESPMNDYAMLSVLRSDMFGFSLDRISEIALEEGDSFSEKARKLFGAGAEDLAAFFDYLARMRELSGVLSLYELVSRLIDEKMRLPVLRRLDGRKVFGEILAFAEGLKSMDPMPSISEYLPYFDRYFKAGEDGEVAESDAVKVMSIHASKGLEFPVVFVVGLEDPIIGQGDKNENVLLDKEYYFVKNPSGADGVSVYVDQFKGKKRKEVKEDRLRLLYVALTRARNYLFLSGACPDKGVASSKEEAKTLADWVLGSIKETKYAGYLSENPPCSAPEEEIEWHSAVQCENETAALLDAFDWRYPHEKATETSIKFTVTAINEKEEPELPPVEIRFPEEDRKAKGTAFHAAMENAPFTLEGEEETSVFLDGLVADGVIEAADRRALSPREVLGAIKGVRSLVDGFKDYREKSFLLRLPAREAGVADVNDLVLVQGKIDLLAIRGEEAILVDYKRSGLPSPVLAEKYKTQLDLYEKAVRAGFPNVTKVTKYIFVLGRNEEIRVPFE